MKISKVFVLGLAVVLFIVVALAGCGGESPDTGSAGSAGAAPAGSSGASGDADAPAPSDTIPAADLLREVMEVAAAEPGAGSSVSDTINDPVTHENSPGMLGILSDDFSSYVAEAASSIASDAAVAFEAAIIKCRSAEDAALVSELICGGFDSSKWESVMPERSLTVVSGAYVLLAVGSAAETDAVAAAFAAATDGSDTAPEIFYEGEVGGEAAPIEPDSELPVSGDELSVG